MLKGSSAKFAKNQAKHCFLFVMVAIAIVVVTVGTTLLSKMSSVGAARSFNYDSCISGYSAKGIAIDGNSVLTIKNACGYCRSRNGGPYGVLWFNDSMNDPRGNVVRIDSWNQEIKQVALWGGVYSCNNNSNAVNWAHFVWFGLPGQMKGNGTKIEDMQGVADFFDLTQSYYGDSVYRAVFRGKLAGSKYTWSNFDVEPSGGPSNGYALPNIANFYPKRFREAAMNVGGCENITEDGTERLKCSMNISVNRCYSAGSPARYFNSNGQTNQRCYGDPSELVLIAPPYNEGGFSSKSKVSSGAESKESPLWDSNAETLEVNADDSGNATVTFAHKLSYKAESTTGNYNEAWTDWTISVDDGATPNQTGRYSLPGNQNAESDWLPSTPISINVSLGDLTEKTVCSTITYRTKTLQWDNNDPRNMIPANDTGSTKACAKVKRVAPIEKDAEFTSQSFAHANYANLGDTNSAIDGMMTSQDATIESADGDSNRGGAGFISFGIEIDEETVSLDFWHKIMYTVSSTAFTTDDVVPTPATNWTIETKVKKSGRRTRENRHPADTSWSTLSTKTGSYSPDSGKTSATSNNLPDPRVSETISLEKGQSALVCSTITYTPKYIKFKVKEGGDHDGEDGHTTDHKYYEYEISSQTGEGKSQSCIKVYRPTEPEGTPWSGNNSGNPLSDPMYAGEATQIGWDVWAQGSMTNRLTKYQSVNYVAGANVGYNPGVLGGTYKKVTTSDSAICSFYSSLWSSTSLCRSLGDHSGATQSIFWDERNETQDIVAPNEVGRKHSNTAGYFYEVWRCVPNPPPGTGCTWKHFPNEDYWSIYNTAARPVLKKPTVDVWNGGLFTSAAISTQLAPRYEVGLNSLYTPKSSVESTLKTFGSWGEYLVTAGGQVSSFTSGSVLSQGIDGDFGNIMTNSPLTIANSSANVGNSGINYDAILRERLQDYFFTKPGVVSGGNGSTITSLLANSTNVQDTVIISVNGTLVINENIILNRYSSYQSIHTLPQVVIYASGGIQIKSNVTQVDAWLITDGTLDTCSDFQSGTTEAAVRDRNLNTDCSKHLQVNGPVMASAVKLNRTYGADGYSNDDEDKTTNNAGGGNVDKRSASAETFNLSPDVYMWAYAQSSRYKSSYSEAYSRELPPRY